MNIFDRARNVIPMGTMTSSKAACRFAEGFGPTHIESGRGAMVWTTDGKEYIDWAMGLGSVTLGHADEDVLRAAHDAALGGISHSLSTPWEVELAEMIVERVPCAQMVRFMKNGSDATSAAVRLARAFTGSDIIVRCGYHGWHDWALNADYQDKKGVPQCVRDLTISVPYNDLYELEDKLRWWKVAAFILEPVSLIPPANGYLAEAKRLCARYGALLIFDEVITGMRMSSGGAQQVFGVEPDLCALGKGLANGWPLSAVCGRRDVMMEFTQTHISGTYCGETGSIAAAIATIEKLERTKFWDHQYAVGVRLTDAYEELAGQYGMGAYTKILGMPHWTSIQWPDPAHFTLFQQEMLRQGILFSGSQFPCLAHTDELVDRTIHAYEVAMAVVADAIQHNNVADRLECKVNTTVFRRH